ncbi:hypothetical protein [Legionella sp. W05-934-2]|jgi:streptomycin 3"-adenylyltransferase|uniref:hypothetical protein n=1 Tax=Legionella sp. W05-934-2 TaxID=1198649 RepID=UPI0034622138
MTYVDSHEMKQQLEDSLELLKMILGPDLLGVYLYGSSLVGGLQKYSDVVLVPKMSTGMILNCSSSLVQIL